MSVLRQPHDHHRDLRARLRAEVPAHTGSGGDQDRHLMMPSPPIDDRPDTRYSCSLAAGTAKARSTSKPLARPSVLTHAWPQTDRGNRSSPTSARTPPRPNPHSARGTAAAHLPRFRAFALFERRPPERVEGVVIPASENLHIRRIRHTTHIVRSHGPASFVQFPIEFCSQARHVM